MVSPKHLFQRWKEGAAHETAACSRNVKLSAPNHEARPPDYTEVLPLARALVEARWDRVLWGSDWPHTNSTLLSGLTAHDVNPFYAVDNRRLFDVLADWAPSAADRRRILVDNPARLFGF